MGTRSMIGKLQEDGSVKAIYCHWDGYPSNNGSILIKSYGEPDKVDKLIGLGDLSSLGNEIGDSHDFGSCPDGVCNAYGRDRGEDDVDAREYVSEETYAGAFRESWAEYAYLFKSGKWHIEIDGKFVELTKKMCRNR